LENRLKVYRAMKDITQENLAKAVGVSRQTVIAIEKGNYNPSLELAFKIVRFFEVRIEDVFIYDDAREK
jgi:putative transcriptional regulator